jgi:hypothetical protein
VREKWVIYDLFSLSLSLFSLPDSLSLSLSLSIELKTDTRSTSSGTWRKNREVQKSAAFAESVKGSNSGGK